MASIGATCLSGIELERVEVPTTSANFSITRGDEVVVVDDSEAKNYQYYRMPNQQDVRTDNSYGFRAIWLA